MPKRNLFGKLERYFIFLALIRYTIAVFKQDKGLSQKLFETKKLSQHNMHTLPDFFRQSAKNLCHLPIPYSGMSREIQEICSLFCCVQNYY